MTQVQNSPTVLDTPPSSGRSTLSKVATIALLGNGLAYFAMFLAVFFVEHKFIPPLLIIGIVTLLVTGLTSLRVRWAAVPGVVLAIALLALNMSMPQEQHFFTHPGEGLLYFILLAKIYFTVVGVIAGVAATVQHYRHPGAPAPGNLRLLLSSFTCFTLGMLLVSLIVAANPPSSAASTTKGQPTVHLSVSDFTQNVVLVPKGSTLRLIDDDRYHHVLRNGYWTAADSPQSRVEPGAPVVSDVSIRSGSLDLGPYATAGIYHLYCTIHPQMNLTVVVQ